MQSEKNNQSCLTMESTENSPAPDAHLLRLALLCWVQKQINNLLARWRLLLMTHGRGWRWRISYRRLLQGAAAMLLAGGMLLSPLAPAMPAYASAVFAEQIGTGNPLNGVDVGQCSTPVFVDIDGDGDMDAFSGASSGAIKYYQNSGTAVMPAFSEQTGTSNPFNSVDVGEYSAPAFVDIDHDGDMDAFIGEYDGTLKYYQNSGTALTPAFSAQTGTSNPLESVDVGWYSTPTFVDIDSDGDMDAFIGEQGYVINYFKNTGTALAPAFSEQTGTNNPFNSVDVGGWSNPNFVDIDGDGDMDAFIGEYYGAIKYDKNNGTALAPAFSEQNGTNNPFDGVDVGIVNTPAFVDIDQDGDMDAFVGEYDGNLNYYKNIGNNTALHVYSQKTGAVNPLNGVDVGVYSTPIFVDIDGDGDMDAFSGENVFATIMYYQNSGNSLAPAFSEQTGTDNPLDSVDLAGYSAPTFVDIDQDGDMDAFIGEFWGNLKYYQNMGTALAPTFSEQTGTSNPFNGVSVAYASNPAFVDIDSDGDLDAFIGTSDGTLKYYQNTGTVMAPAFSVQTGTSNPLDLDVGYRSTPTFVDIDGDGDMDAFIGEHDGVLNYYKNTGTALAPAFSEQTGISNPLDSVDVGLYSTPTFVDIDGDGDIDAFIGESEGTIIYYKATRLEIKIPLVLR